MNNHYTDETRTIFINSVQRISGTDADLIIEFDATLPNEYERFNCETISFYGQSISINNGITGASASRYCPSVDVFDFMENNYNSTDKYNGQTIVAGVTFHGGSQYILRNQSLPFIAKNFNNKRIRFAMRSVQNTYVGTQFTGTRNWTLLLSVTPIKENPYHISNKKYESFTYTITSNQIISGTVNDCIIRLKPINNDNYSRYFVDVKIMQHTQNLLVIEDYLIMFCNGWSETEYGDTGQIVGAMVDSGGASNGFDTSPGADNAVFVIKNMKQNRDVRFTLRYNDL